MCNLHLKVSKAEKEFLSARPRGALRRSSSRRRTGAVPPKEGGAVESHLRLSMGIIRSSFSFIAGTVCGIYIAQNYQILNIKKLAYSAIFRAKEVEEKYRKPKKAGEGDE